MSYPVDLYATAIIAMAPNLDSPSLDQERSFLFNDLTIYQKPFEGLSFDENKTLRFKGRLNQISSLKENWDGFGASVISEKITNQTMGFLSAIPSHLISKIDEDSIYPTPYGTILMELDINDSELSIEIGEDEISYYLEVDNTIIGENVLELDENFITLDMLNEFNHLLERVD